MNQKYRLAIPEFPKGWMTDCNNNFYDIDPGDNISLDDKFEFIFWQEDMIQIRNGEFLLDLGWYGQDDLDSPYCGYGLILFRGSDFKHCELLEKYRSKSKNDVVKRIFALFDAVDKGFYENRSGYLINEDDMSKMRISEYDPFTLLQT